MMSNTDQLDSNRSTAELVYASGQEPRVGDVICYPGTAKYPEPRVGRVERVISNDPKNRTPGRIRVDRDYTDGQRPAGANCADKIKPIVATLLHCRDCAEDGTRMVSDGAGGIEWDICPRCGGADEAVPLEELNSIAF